MTVRITFSRKKIKERKESKIDSDTQDINNTLNFLNGSLYLVKLINLLFYNRINATTNDSAFAAPIVLEEI